jgi:hypothetical protein
MRRLFEPRQVSSGAMVVAILALVMAMAGGAVAAKLIKTNKIANGAVTGKKLAKGAVASKVTFSVVGGPKVVVPAGQSVSTTVSCPPNTEAIGGGAEIVSPTNASEGGTLVASFRSGNPRLWTIRVAANGGTARSWLTSAECVKLG